ncbi:MAG: sporulation protein YabP [Oscillospiraceae bacterium]|jgi:sporulation protein YabP|nr:sporulation protein YabP [Oscillospiraceae bacterium]
MANLANHANAADEKKSAVMPHTVMMEDRRLLTVSGVSDVDSFDEHTVTVFTDLGELTVRGDDLHINRLSVEVGELLLEGKIVSLTYQEDTPRQSGGFFSKVFR